MRARTKTLITPTESMRLYIYELVHDWSMTLTVLGFTLVPVFFVLDYFVMPAELLPRFVVYRGVATVGTFLQFLVLRATRPSKWSVLHGYFTSLMVGGTIALMTTYLGGFNSTYYAGLNLVIVAVTILLPWGLLHSTLNASLVVVLYVGLNLVFRGPEPIQWSSLVNNMFFLSATAIISVSISYVKHRLVRKEFVFRSELKSARDALWGEMEVAKRIQTSLLPDVHRLPGYEIGATMIPAAEVGGDYYDVIETATDESWVAIGDVSGHGVESGLIMMMTQTSIFTTVNRTTGYTPSQVLTLVNSVIKENISRLGSDRYMTLSAMVLRDDKLVFAGKHQDLLVYRRATGSVEVIPTVGTWLGVIDDLTGVLPDTQVEIHDGDVVLLYTDGATEAADRGGKMFGEVRLMTSLSEHARLGMSDLVHGIIADIQTHMASQEDDMTILAIRKMPRSLTG